MMARNIYLGGNRIVESGGGIYLSRRSVLQMNHSIVADNFAGLFGGK